MILEHSHWGSQNSRKVILVSLVAKHTKKSSTPDYLF
jgi:hypothetical protein